MFAIVSCLLYAMITIEGGTMCTEIIKKAEEIIVENLGKETFCTLALIDSEGFPTTSTITASKAKGIEELTFCGGIHSNKTLRIKENDKASVCFNNNIYNIALIGTMEILSDETTKKDMWYQGLENHFSGPNDPNYCVYKFKTKRYSLLIDWEEVQGTI